MKSLIFFFFLLISFNISAQEDEFAEEYESIRRYSYEISQTEQWLKTKMESVSRSGMTPGQQVSANAEYTSEAQSKINEYQGKINYLNLKIKEQKDKKEASESDQAQIRRNAEKAEYQNKMKAIVLERKQTREETEQRVIRNLDNIDNDIRYLQDAALARELSKRNNGSRNYVKFNLKKFDDIVEVYEKIPTENFDKIIDGQYSANIVYQAKYSFVDFKTVTTVLPVIVKVVKNKVVEIYVFGEKEYKIDLSKKKASSWYLSNGIVEYTDLVSNRVTKLILLTPYFLSNPREETIRENKVGYIIPYVSNKKDEGKVIWVQLWSTSYDMIIEEFPLELIYAENNKDAEAKIVPYPVGAGLDVYFMGPPDLRPNGYYMQYYQVLKGPKTKPLESGETRIVKIPKYRN